MPGLCVSQRGFWFWCHHQRILRPHTLTHPPTHLTALVDTKKRTRARVGGEARRKATAISDEPTAASTAASCKGLPPMMDATIAQTGLASTPGLPKQANRGILNSHEASNVPQHGRHFGGRERDAVVCRAVPCSVAPQAGEGWICFFSLCLLTDLSLRVCVILAVHRHNRLNSFLPCSQQTSIYSFWCFLFFFILSGKVKSWTWLFYGAQQKKMYTIYAALL